MKKILTLAAAVLASLSLWAADPTVSSYDWEKDVVAVGDVLKTYATEGIVVSSSTSSLSNNSGVVKESKRMQYLTLSNNATALNENYFDIKSTKDIIDSVAVFWVVNGTNKTQPAWLAWADGVEPALEVSAYGLFDAVTSSRSYENAVWFTINLSGKKITDVRIARSWRAGQTFEGNAIGNLGEGQTMNILGYKIWTSPKCEDPNASLEADPAIAFVNDEVELLYSSDIAGDPNWSVKKDGVAAAAGVDYTLADARFHGLVAGEFEITATQDADGTHCAVEESVIVTVNAKTPVSAVSVAGPAEGFIGAELVYTATAEGATAYEWYLDDVKQGSDSAKFIYTAVKGSHSIVCKARNNFNAAEEWIASDPKAVTVTKLCGELIKATRNGKNIDPVTGIVGGTAAKNTQDGGKLGSNGHYWKLTLASGNFMIGDTVVVNVSTAGGQGKIAITSDQAGSNVLGTLGDYGTTGDNKVVLTKGGVNTIWLSRDGTNNTYNGVVDAISVSRSCEESDNNNATVTINGEAAEKSGTVFNYTLSASYTDPTVAVEITLEHPLATLMEDHAASFTMVTPEAGEKTVETFKVKAENGEQAWYSIFVEKSAELSHDATLKSLSVTGYPFSFDFAPTKYSYYITKAYGTEDPGTDKVVYETNHAGATVQVQSLTNALYVTVYAEDGVTHTAYTINIETADALRALNEVIMSNKYKAYILEADPTNIYAFYLKGEDAPTVQSCNVSEGATWAVADGKLKVTGADSKFDEYTLNIAEVTPLEYTADKIIFDGTETWIKSGYGFDDTKKWRFSKTDNDFSRERAGKTHIEMFLPACDTVVLTEANVASRDIKLYANGVQIGSKVSLAQGKDLKVVVEQASAFMLTIESAQTGGDGGVGAIRLAKIAFTVTYNAGAGTCETASENVVKGNAVTLPAATREGYTFDGWFTAAEEGELIGKAGDEYTPAASITLFAHYTAEEPAGCNWASLSWIACAGGLEAYANQYKICVGNPAPGVDIIQNPGWATAPGLYLIFPTDLFGAISLASTDYDKQGAGILLHIAIFTDKETEVTIPCKKTGADENYTNYTFTIYNDKGTPTAIDNANVNAPAVKRIVNGQLVIEFNGRSYNILGAEIK